MDKLKLTDIEKLQKQLDIHKDCILDLLERERQSILKKLLFLRVISIILILYMGYVTIRWLI